MNETLGRIHFWLSFVGAYCIFMPFHYLGLAGNVRRYSTFVDDLPAATDPGTSVHHHRGACSRRCAQVIFLYNLIHSRFWGAPATDNPWEATSLEWSTRHSSDLGQFRREAPRWFITIPINMALSSVGDYVMQTSPEQGEDGARRGRKPTIRKKFALWQPPFTNRQNSTSAGRPVTGNGGWRKHAPADGRLPGSEADFAPPPSFNRHLGLLLSHHHDVSRRSPAPYSFARDRRSIGSTVTLPPILYLNTLVLFAQQRHARTGDAAMSRFMGRCEVL